MILRRPQCWRYPGYLERFLMEEWIARRVNSAHVLKAGLQKRQRNYLYTVTEYALHRMEILHQDIRPDNIMIDTNGTVKIIDFGSARVAGIAEATMLERNPVAFWQGVSALLAGAVIFLLNT